MTVVLRVASAPSPGEVAAARAVAPSSGSLIETARLPALRVLIVDDEPGNVAVLRSSLPSPLVVDVAINGRAAVEKAETFRPDVIFMDVNMPGVDGLEVCRYLRREPTTVGLPIIIVSAAVGF